MTVNFIRFKVGDKVRISGTTIVGIVTNIQWDESVGYYYAWIETNTGAYRIETSKLLN